MKNTYKTLLLCGGFLWFVSLMCFTQGLNHERSLFLKALKVYETSDYPSAFKLFEQLSKLNPKEPQYYLYAGLSLLNTSDAAQEALVWFDNGLRCDSIIPASPEIRADLMLAKGEALQVVMRLDEAIELYDRLISSSGVAGAVDEAWQKKQQAMRNLIFVENAIPAKIKNLGEPVNSPFDDHTGCFNLTGDVIYFTSKRSINRKDGGEQERIFFSEKKDSLWLPPQVLQVFGKNHDHESVSSLSCDESLMTVFQSAGGRQDVFTMKNERGEWKQPQRFAQPVGSAWNQTHVSFSPDLSTVFFTSDRPGGFGGLDIYMSKRLDGKRWGKARNLGSKVNSPLDEETPFMHANGHTLYFASEGHNGMGRFDIFFAEMLPDSSFSEAGNMGYPINSMEDDFAFFPDVSNRQAILSSTRNDRKVGGCDLFVIDLDASSNSQVAVLKLVANDSLGSVSRVLIKRQVDSLLVGDYRPDVRTGEYTAFLETGYGYSILNRTDSVEYYAKPFYLPDAMAYHASRQIFGMDELPLRAEEPIAVAHLEEPALDSLAQQMEEGFIIQVLALKRRPLFAGSYLRALKSHPVRSIRCSDGYVRYVYGHFKTKEAALLELSIIKKGGRYGDAYVRTLKSLELLAMPAVK